MGALDPVKKRQFHTQHGMGAQRRQSFAFQMGKIDGKGEPRYGKCFGPQQADTPRFYLATDSLGRGGDGDTVARCDRCPVIRHEIATKRHQLKCKARLATA